MTGRDQELARLLAGPSGLGTSACRFPRTQGTGTSPPDPGGEPGAANEAAPGAVTEATAGTDAEAAVGAAAEAECEAADLGAGMAEAAEVAEVAGATSAAAPADPAGSGSIRSRDLVRKDIYAPIPYLEREWGDGSYPPLYCPATVRIDEELGEEVNRRLVAWAEKVGIYATQMDKFRATGFGRLAMLTHPDSDDPDMLLVAAQMNAAWWAADDYYADETSLGASPTELPPRLSLVMAAMDPPPPAGQYTSQLDDALAADPVLVSISSATAHMARHATPSQVMRARHATAQMYVGWTAYAAWRYLGKPPPVWRYLAARQHDSFYTSMTLIDIVAGYELTADLFGERRVRRALLQAGTAAVIVNDLHSAAREAADELPDSNLVLLIAAEENCSIREATVRTVELHNDFVRSFEAGQRRLAAVGSVELQRFLRGAQAWMGGGFEWHSSSDRYK